MTIHLKMNKVFRTLGKTVMVAVPILTSSCSENIDNLFSKNMSQIQLNPSGEYIKLDESNPNGTALTIEWNAAHDFGDEYITTYKYEFQLVGSKADVIKEYEDDG